jgi:hypothetical protein
MSDNLCPLDQPNNGPKTAYIFINTCILPYGLTESTITSLTCQDISRVCQGLPKWRKGTINSVVDDQVLTALVCHHFRYVSSAQVSGPIQMSVLQNTDVAKPNILW